ncbi:MAG: rhodanese-like domain-containing protein [Verrucomicrobiota bacterium]
MPDTADSRGNGPAEWPPAEEIEIEPGAVAALLAEKADFRLIDCREEDEWELTRIEAAELLPLSEFGERYAAVLPDKNERLVIQCHHGMRSAKAANFLRTKGYTRAWSMARGIEGWSTEVDSGVPRY